MSTAPYTFEDTACPMGVEAALPASCAQGTMRTASLALRVLSVLPLPTREQTQEIM